MIKFEITYTIKWINKFQTNIEIFNSSKDAINFKNKIRKEFNFIKIEKERQIKIK
jgi:hypothetical protein